MDDTSKAGVSNAVDYDEIAARLTDPATPLQAPTAVRTGDDAVAYGRDMLLREFGSDEAIAQAVRRGRPRVGSGKQGPSPVVRGAIPQEEYLAFKELERITGEAQADIVRRAVHALLVAENLVS